MNKVELIKKAKMPLRVISDIYRYAESGYDSIEPDDFTLFKWYGVYEQRPKGDGNFMMRIKVPGGNLTSVQMRELAAITKEYARGISDITTRQTFQLHWLRIEQFPDIFKRMDAVGITSSGACGDIARNVTSCPVAGLAHDEVFDVRPTVQALHEYFLDNTDFQDLPRKYKIAVVGCPVHCALPQINDFAMVAVLHPTTGERGFHFYVGGGLSTQPHIAQNIRFFIPESKVIDGARAVSQIYRDSLQLREKRTHARLKFLVADNGVDWFREEFLSRLDWRPEDVDGWTLPEDTFRDHLGVNSQVQPGLNWIGLCILTGRMTDHQMVAAADIAEKYGAGELRTTNVQNLLIPNIPDENLEAAKAALKAEGFEWEVPAIRRGAIACTGIEFCNLALTETKQRMKDIIAYLETRIDVNYPIKINMNGCPNSCAQHHVGDIGLQGCIAKLPDGRKVDAYDIHLGGHLGQDAHFTHAIHRKVPGDNIQYAIENLINAYNADHAPGEKFGTWTHRHTDEQLDGFLAVETIVGAPDLPASAKELIPA